LVAQDQLHPPAYGRVGRLVNSGLEYVDEDLFGRADEAREDAFERGLGIERHAADPVRADGAGRRRILRLGKVAPETLGHEPGGLRSEEHTSELQSRGHLVCRLLLEKKKIINHQRCGNILQEYWRTA